MILTSRPADLAFATPATVERELITSTISAFNRHPPKAGVFCPNSESKVGVTFPQACLPADIYAAKRVKDRK